MRSKARRRASANAHYFPRQRRGNSNVVRCMGFDFRLAGQAQTDKKIETREDFFVLLFTCLRSQFLIFDTIDLF